MSSGRDILIYFLLVDCSTVLLTLRAGEVSYRTGKNPWVPCGHKIPLLIDKKKGGGPGEARCEAPVKIHGAVKGHATTAVVILLAQGSAKHFHLCTTVGKSRVMSLTTAIL